MTGGWLDENSIDSSWNIWVIFFLSLFLSNRKQILVFRSRGGTSPLFWAQIEVKLLSVEPVWAQSSQNSYWAWLDLYLWARACLNLFMKLTLPNLEDLYTVTVSLKFNQGLPNLIPFRVESKPQTGPILVAYKQLAHCNSNKFFQKFRKVTLGKMPVYRHVLKCLLPGWIYYLLCNP